MRIPSRYLVGRFFQLFLAILIGANLTIAIVEMLIKIHRMLDFGAGGARGILHYLALRLPAEYASYVIPTSAFGAALLSLALSANKRELMALKAGGIPTHRISLPIAACGLAVGLATIVLHETVFVAAAQEFNQVRRGGDPIQFRRGSFWYQRGNTIYNVAEADAANRVLRRVAVYERTPEGRLARSVHAPRVEILDDHRWRFHEARVRTFDPQRPGAAATNQRLDSTEITLGDSSQLALLNAEPALLRTGQLREYISVRRESGAPIGSHETMFHSRIAGWIAAPLLVLAAIPLGLRVEQHRSVGRAASQAIGILVVFFAIQNAGTVLGSSGIAPPAVGPWAALTVFAGGALLAFVRAHR